MSDRLLDFTQSPLGKQIAGFLGMPIEGFAFSKNAMGLFGPPSFKEASVVHPSPSAHTITQPKSSAP